MMTRDSSSPRQQELASALYIARLAALGGGAVLFLPTHAARARESKLDFDQKSVEVRPGQLDQAVVSPTPLGWGQGATPKL